MFQIRRIGAIQELPTITEASRRTKERPVDKLSFNSEDGSRIRLVHQGNGQYTVTYWDAQDPDQYMYRVFGKS